MNTKPNAMSLTFDHLSPAEFEEFTYDLLQQFKFTNLSWRKGTGKSGASADQGRDLEADFHRIDFDSTEHFEKYFIQCKHYKEGVPPSKLQDALAWALAERPSVLLFVVSNALSNSAKQFIADYEKNNRPPFRVKQWERKELEGLLASKPALVTKYRLGSIQPDTVIHPAHLIYISRPILNTVEQMLTILDSVEEQKRDNIFIMTYDAIINPRYRQPIHRRETINDLLIDSVDYQAFRAKCLTLSKEIGSSFLVRAIITDALEWAAHLGNPMDVDRRIALHQDLIENLEKKRAGEEDPERRYEIQGLLDITRKQSSTVRDRQMKSENDYNFLCETILPRLFLGNLTDPSFGPTAQPLE
jgi:restriction endonuclease